MELQSVAPFRVALISAEHVETPRLGSHGAPRGAGGSGRGREGLRGEGERKGAGEAEKGEAGKGAGVQGVCLGALESREPAETPWHSSLPTQLQCAGGLGAPEGGGSSGVGVPGGETGGLEA